MLCTFGHGFVFEVEESESESAKYLGIGTILLLVPEVAFLGGLAPLQCPPTTFYASQTKGNQPSLHLIVFTVKLVVYDLGSRVHLPPA